MTHASTDNSVKYQFADFTHANYARLLAMAAERYVFRQYHDFHAGESFVLWRHDLDFSVCDALPLARMEAEAGLRCSYFVLLHGSFYNPFDARSRRAVAEIAAMGHEIGLHFDFDAGPVANESQLTDRLAAESNILSNLYGLPVRAFSFHNPGPSALAFDAASYAGLVNTYSSYFRSQVAYCSDSNGHWRFERLEDMLSQPVLRPLQVLTHPTWWSAQVKSPRQKVRDAVAGIGSSIIEEYASLLTQNGRKDIDW